MKIIIRTWENDSFADTEVEAIPVCPGLALHHSHNADSWSITHIPTGLAVAWWADDEDAEQILWCATQLAKLGDWTGNPQHLKDQVIACVRRYGGSMRQAASLPVEAAQAERERTLSGPAVTGD
jgi:hypothetical protein